MGLSSDRGVAYPEDPALDGLEDLFDDRWVWRAYRRRFGDGGSLPRRVALFQVRHSPGRRILVTHRLEWPSQDYLPAEFLTLSLDRVGRIDVFKYPQDPHLPGLVGVADPVAAHGLIGEHVLTFPSRRLRVELVRYRPASRAVLHHRAGKARFYVRAIRPKDLPPLLDAATLIQRSGFAAPRIAGVWEAGAVVWLAEIPGRNLRRALRKGNPPDPDSLLSGLETIWRLPPCARGAGPFNLAGRYRYAKRLIGHAFHQGGDSQDLLKATTETLDPFVDGWEPSTVAHNDFYDDQMIVLPDGRVSLVDFEEAGAGDPMLDVGNFLAHLRWNSTFRPRAGDATGAYHHAFRQAALHRFGWNPAELNLREAVCLFRICTNPIRRPRSDWHRRLEGGLRLVKRSID